MCEAGSDSPDRLPDVGGIPLRALDELGESALAHALSRIIVSLDTKSAEAAVAFQSLIDDDYP
ncbi:FXSXX-COOH protein [Thermomonospora echinospora]|uniref:FXSXX-COOH protein n=1 Tax=Thermomonospora echinospora TaxID=1992 RepID=A0A1H5ZY41_9ACTN|nr:FxSxx-COOH cyclophane-containing RiPP peptide [Thermomonospora echinospora]SEG40376.1 FXSXX-COOH protein [Thermomonospora echinospora]